MRIGTTNLWLLAVRDRRARTHASLGGPVSPRRRNPMAAMAGGALVAGALAACGGPSGAGGSERVTIYSGRTENLISPILERFAAETGIAVDVRYGQSADLALLIDTEADRSPADVYLSQSPGAVAFLAQKGRLAPLRADTLGRVDEASRSPAGLWVGISGRVRVLVYNSDLVAEADLPASVFDLTGPAFADKVALAPANGSFQDFVTGMRQSVGEERTLGWLTGMKDNGARTYANNTAIVEAVGRGEVPFGLVNHYYNFRALAEDPDLPTRNHIFPDADIGAMNLITGASVVAATDDSESARRLVDFLLGTEAQQFFSEESFEYPLASGVAPSHGLPPLSEIETPTFEADSLGGGLARTKELIDASGLESA
ncbi:MAG: iron ABC transporter substrate-binding protein [Acidimicrobiales bacterium]